MISIVRTPLGRPGAIREEKEGVFFGESWVWSPKIFEKDFEKVIDDEILICLHRTLSPRKRRSSLKDTLCD
jgi:hypothetical protein